MIANITFVWKSLPVTVQDSKLFLVLMVLMLANIVTVVVIAAITVAKIVAVTLSAVQVAEARSRQELK